MGSVIVAILFFYQSGSFLDSYLKNGHHFIQCICDDKHIRTKVMNLKGLSDYSAPFQFNARDSAPRKLSPTSHTRILCNIFFAIHCCSECFGLLVRCPSWTSNSTEAENCTKNEQMRKLICCWRTVIFCDYKVSIHVNKLCIKRKTTIMVQRSSMMCFIIPLRTSALAQYS